jgi:L-aspartate oxidase
MKFQSEFLVIGSGIAGLSFALRAAETGSVAIVTKKAKAESTTNYAQGGIASVIAPDDSFEAHIRDTLIAGAGLCHKDAVEVLVKEGPARIDELIQIGVEFTMRNGRLDLGREGGHSMNRIVHARDLTGKEIERALLVNVMEHPNIRMFENHIAIDLVTEHQLGLREGQKEKHCWGAYVLDVEKNQVKSFVSGVTMLATGSLGQVYLHTSNPDIATGDGIAMAYRAGAAIANMEFIQFHPTTLYHPASTGDTTTSFLISEAVRGFGAVLVNRDGAEFMQKYDQRGSLAPRDIVARAIDSELKRSGVECVYLKLTHLNPREVQERFPNIYRQCLENKIDMTSELVPVVPAAHYSCGGVVTDLNGRTTIQNLYACGEVSMTGVHGANRLASNSLLEAVVFAHRAIEDVRIHMPLHDDLPSVPPWDESGTFNSEEWVLIAHNRREIQQLMWDYVGIVRSNLRLERAHRRILLILDEVMTFYKKTKITEGLIEMRNLAITADCIIRSALMRRESRGLHYTTDYPEKDDSLWLHDTVLQRK